MTNEEKNTPQSVWNQYLRGISYNTNLELPETVERNENFYIGNQWVGLSGVSELDKPVVNFLGRVVGYFVSTITSEKIEAAASFFNSADTDGRKAEAKILDAQIEQSIEACDLNGMAKDFVRNAAVDGDAAAHLYFDPDAPSGQAAEGLVSVEPLSNLDVIFADPQEARVEKQKWVIIVSRAPLEDVRRKLPEAAAGTDPMASEMAKKDESQRVTVLTKYFRKNGEIWRYQCTEQGVIREEENLHYRRYPVAWWPWEAVKDSYHGQAAVTVLIPNQIAVNKAYAMAWKQQRDLAFQKIVYDKSKIPNWSNRIGAIGVNGDVRAAVSSVSAAADIPQSTIPMIDSMMSNTRDMMGASDAALGNISPDNTSAIIAVQQATAVPLELKKRSFGQFVESIVRSMLDIIVTDYGVREIAVADAMGNRSAEVFDFSSLRESVVKLKIDIGSTPYWTPETQAKQMENLWHEQIIRKRSQLLENMPDGLLPNKAKLLAEIRVEEEQEAVIQNAMRQMSSGVPPDAAGGGQGAVPVPAV